jgi:hypothetical protein
MTPSKPFNVVPSLDNDWWVVRMHALPLYMFQRDFHDRADALAMDLNSTFASHVERHNDDVARIRGRTR